METTAFREKFTKNSGILELMEDLSSALTSKEKIYMLGGGNPAQIPEMNRFWKQRLEEIAVSPADLTSTLTAYDSAQGNPGFLLALAELFNREYGWEITPENIGVTNGSQNSFFLLFNLFGGINTRGKQSRILLPLCPEYVGYADQLLSPGGFITRKARIQETGPREFKYHVDFDNLEIPRDVNALCASRPTNPTGNVLTDQEVKKLSRIAEEREIPLLLDNAYGAPFPNILFQDVTPVWNENIVLSMSLSKLGLPSARTGIIVAKKETIKALTAANAIISLANGTLGQIITRPLIESGMILEMSKNIVRPYYEKKSVETVNFIHKTMDSSVDYRIHRSEGAIFLWIWFKNLSISSRELYERLKKRNVIVLSGEHFFFGLENPWEHSSQCIRLNYAQETEDVRRGIEILAEEAYRAVHS